MTSQRDRQASGVATADAPRPADPAPRHAPPTDPTPPVWSDYFAVPASADAPPALAALVAALHRAAPGPYPPPADRIRHWLPAILAGESVPPPLVLPPQAGPDLALDARQADAVRRALATPDVCLAQGLPGSGRTRTVVEAVRRCVEGGGRVLLVGTPQSIEAALERLADSPMFVYRAVGRDERPEDLPPLSRAASLAGLTAALRDAATPSAQGPAALLARWEQEAGPRMALGEMAARSHDLGVELARLQLTRGTVEEAIAASIAGIDPDSEPLRARLAQQEAKAKIAREAALTEAARLREEVAAQRKVIDERTAALAKLRPLAEAKQGQKVLSGSFWKAMFAGDVVAQAQQFAQEMAAATDKATELESQAAEYDAKAAKADAEAAAARTETLAIEARRRYAALDEKEASIRAELAVIADKWRQQSLSLSPDLPRPASPTPAAVEEAEWLARRLLGRLRAEATTAAAWSTGYSRLAEDLPSRLPMLVSIVAATPTGLASDPLFGEPGGVRLGFDLLVADDAHDLGEPDFSRLARRARRQFLVGDRTTEELPDPDAGRDRRGGRPPARGPRRPSFFARLWQRLHCDTWVREGERLACRFTPVPAEDRERLEAEPVLDVPDTELRFYTPPNGSPAIAEVVFPPGKSLSEAKGFIFRELEQLALGCRPGEGVWSESAGRLLWSVGGCRPAGERLELAPGVCEWVADVGPAGTSRTVPLPWPPAALEFNTAAGWDREKAEAWLRKHQRFPDAGRTVRLDLPYRHVPALAAFLADVLHPGETRGVAEVLGEPAAFFLPVPGLPEGRSNGNGPRRIPSNLRGGAGLEADLGDARTRDRLPAELRPGMPERGFINPMEAQAIARYLDGEFRKGLEGSVAILTLTTAQVEAVRRTLRQYPGLVAKLDRITVDVPGAVRHREFDTVVVGLTRSHTHRAVAFGDVFGWLPLAMTRARVRLVLVGDPGTLARRTQWDAALEHLSERQSTREREWIAAIVRQLQGEASHARLTLLAGYRS